MFNKEQREGLARMFDTLTASAIIGLVVGLTNRAPLSQQEALALCLICLLLVTLSLRLRRQSS